ncbi:MAG: lytic transglycosylase domain-containing protein [Spirochaetaceae bacterium]|nr:lytic transglycosylase domain-containing protein [Spirochaetaceae bacterium]
MACCSSLVVRLRFFLLFISFIAASCNAQSVLNLSRREAEKRIAAGNVDFIISANTGRMGEIGRIDASAPFYAALHLGEDSSDEAREKKIALFREALKSPLVREAALEKLISLDGDAALALFSRGVLRENGSVWINAFRQLATYKLLAAVGKTEPSAELKRFFFNEPLGDVHKWLWKKLRETFEEENNNFLKITENDTQQAAALEQSAAGQPPTEKSATEQPRAGQAPAGSPKAEQPQAGQAIVELTASGDVELKEQPLQRELKLPAAFELIEGRFLVAASDYGAAFRAFRRGFKDERDAFLENGELLSDFGRALQYAAPQEGLRIFSELERSARKNDEARYKLIFFSGRMARQLRRPKEAIRFFADAAKIAPDSEQKDACIWYLLSTAYNEKEENLIEAAATWAPQWHDASYFNDLFDKFGAWAAKKKRFDYIRNAFFAIKDYAGTEIYASYAYICGRATELGFLSKHSDKETAAYFYNLAYSGAAARRSDVPSFYYRALAAERLDIPLDIDAIIPVSEADSKPTGNLAFFEGFFRFGAAKYMYPYVSAKRKELSVEDMRYLAEKLEEAKQWQPAINLTLYYMKRKDYQLKFHDLELRFPKGHPELIERYAKIAGIEPALLYGLVRRESVFNANARSRVGAAGLTQLMNATGNEMARQLAKNGGADYTGSGQANLYDPEINLHLGALYYKQLLTATKSATLAILSYNGGIGRILRWRRALKELSDDLFLETIELNETRNYGRGVLGDEIVYKYLYFNSN